MRAIGDSYGTDEAGISRHFDPSPSEGSGGPGVVHVRADSTGQRNKLSKLL